MGDTDTDNQEPPSSFIGTEHQPDRRSEKKKSGSELTPPSGVECFIDRVVKKEVPEIERQETNSRIGRASRVESIGVADHNSE